MAGWSSAAVLLRAVVLVYPRGLGYGDVRLRACSASPWAGSAGAPVVGLYAGFLLGGVLGGVLLACCGSSTARATRSGRSCCSARWSGCSGGPTSGAVSSTADGSGRRRPAWNTGAMLRWLTAGESHGPALVADPRGAAGPRRGDHRRHRRRAGPPPARLRPRRADEVRAGRGDACSAASATALTQGGPVAIEIANTEWPKWEQVMARRPGRPGDARRPGPQRRADPAPARATPTWSACRSTPSTRPGRCSSAPRPARPPPAWRSAAWRRRSSSRRPGRGWSPT